jgi:3-dehydroquinate synthase
VNSLQIDLGPRSYPIYFRTNAQPELVERSLASCATGRAIVITDENVAKLYAQDFVNELRQSGLQATLLTIPVGEAHKTLKSVEKIYQQALQFGVDRKTPIIAYGGGVVGDVAGFVAATLLRGLPLVQVPTTVLSQVDSSTGGKVGVSLAEGKNLIGAFYQPRWVYIDAAHINTLDGAEKRSGMTEALKHGMLADPSLVDDIANQAQILLGKPGPEYLSIVKRAVSIKAQVVADDEFETGRRAILNLGHTLGHALEYDHGMGSLRHGDAVGLGMRFSLALSAKRLHLAQSQVDRALTALDALGSPSDWADRITPTVLSRIHLDKKIHGNVVRVIGLRDLGDPVVLSMSLTEFKETVESLATAERERTLR